MLNKILGFTAVGSLISFPFLLAIFMGIVISNTALLIGIGIWRNEWVMLGSMVVFLVVFYLMGRLWLKRFITSDTYELPQTDSQVLNNTMANLSKNIGQLTTETHQLKEQIEKEQNRKGR